MAGSRGGMFLNHQFLSLLPSMNECSSFKMSRTQNIDAFVQLFAGNKQNPTAVCCLKSFTYILLRSIIFSHLLLRKNSHRYLIPFSFTQSAKTHGHPCHPALGTLLIQGPHPGYSPFRWLFSCSLSSLYSNQTSPVRLWIRQLKLGICPNGTVLSHTLCNSANR